MTTETYEVRDGSRVVIFDGSFLAEVSSRRDHAPRWTELTLYTTEKGHYVLSKIGRTTVVHQPGCPEILSKLNSFIMENPNGDPGGPEWTLHTCVPDDYDRDDLLIEQTRYWAVIAERAEDIVDHLHRRSEGVKTLPRMSVNLLEIAAEKDPEIARAFLVEHVS